MKRKQFLKTAGAGAGSSLFLPFMNRNDPGKKAIKRIKPRALKAGDTIGLIAPAGVVLDPDDFDRMQNVLEEMELRVKFGKHVRKRHGYLAGKDKERAEDLNRFFSDPGIDGIITVRGGWGSSRILSLVDFQQIKKNPKFFCGFSDITTLHMSIFKNTGLVTFHGPNGTSDWTIFTRNQFKKVAFGETDIVLANPPKEVSSLITIQKGKAKGLLFGGNLTILTSLIGTGYLPDMKGSLLFVEDIGEPVYKVDRMLSQLLHAGILPHIAGFVFGRCINCQESRPYSLTLEQVLGDYLKPFEIPAVYGKMISHDPNNLTIPIGVEAELDADSGTLTMLEASVLTSHS